jgi:threonine aldolase
LVILENTQNRCGGVVLTKEYSDEVCKLAHNHDLKLHIDGARIFNAAVASKTSAKALVEAADSVTFCLSKGLCAPVGSVLCGSREFIDKARRIRKMLGGGMRQAGILAAAGLVALDSMVDRLAEDHRRATELASALAQMDGIQFEMGLPQTNMVFPSIDPDMKHSAAEIAKRLSAEGVKVSAVAERRLRLVTHAWVDDAAVQQTLKAFEKVLA